MVAKRLTLDPKVISESVRMALAEDIGSGDISAALISPVQQAKAQIISREMAVICGIAWVNEVFRQIDAHVLLNWQVQDGDTVAVDQTLCILSGKAHSLLTGERSALNFLQTLSATATATKVYVGCLAGGTTKILDTRKTIPGLRLAQKYAVTCGGGYNHRLGLYDAFLIKENHIIACGSITKAIDMARQAHPQLPVEIEVEDLFQLQEAIAAGADIVLLDNFDISGLQQAVAINQGRVKLEASGGIGKDDLQAVAATGIDYISMGVLTKHIQAIDLSMRFLNK